MVLSGQRLMERLRGSVPAAHRLASFTPRSARSLRFDDALPRSSRSLSPQMNATLRADVPPRCPSALLQSGACPQPDGRKTSRVLRAATRSNRLEKASSLLNEKNKQTKTPKLPVLLSHITLSMPNAGASILSIKTPSSFPFNELVIIRGAHLFTHASVSLSLHGEFCTRRWLQKA